MPTWGWMLVAIGVAQILAVAGAVLLLVRLDRRRQAQLQAADDSPAETTLDDLLIDRLRDPEFIAAYQREVRRLLPEQPDRRPSPRPRCGSGTCRCMTCHTRSAESLTLQDGDHDRYPMPENIRQIAIQYCESMLEES